MRPRRWTARAPASLSESGTKFLEMTLISTDHVRRSKPVPGIVAVKARTQVHGGREASRGLDVFADRALGSLVPIRGSILTDARSATRSPTRTGE